MASRPMIPVNLPHPFEPYGGMAPFGQPFRQPFPVGGPPVNPMGGFGTLPGAPPIPVAGPPVAPGGGFGTLPQPPTMPTPQVPSMGSGMGQMGQYAALAQLLGQR